MPPEYVYIVEIGVYADRMIVGAFRDEDAAHRYARMWEGKTKHLVYKVELDRVNYTEQEIAELYG